MCLSRPATSVIAEDGRHDGLRHIPAAGGFIFSSPIRRFEAFVVKQFFKFVFVEVTRYGDKEEIFVFVGVAVLFGYFGADGGGEDVRCDSDVVLVS